MTLLIMSPGRELDLENPWNNYFWHNYHFLDFGQNQVYYCPKPLFKHKQTNGKYSELFYIKDL